MERELPAGRCYCRRSAQCSTYWWYLACQQQSMPAELKAQNFRCYYFKIRFHIILPAAPISLLFLLSDSTHVQIAHIYHASYTPCPSHKSFTHHTNVWCTLQINVIFPILIISSSQVLIFPSASCSETPLVRDH